MANLLKQLGLKRRKGAPLYVPPGHFYSPVTDPALVDAHLRAREALRGQTSLPGIAIDLDAMREVWRALAPFFATMPFKAEAVEGLRYKFRNDYYGLGDGSVLHAMLRHLKPKRMIEIGSGWSSACTLDTIDGFFDAPCALTFIEPHPKILRELLGPAAARADIRVTPVQQVELELFETLEAGDLLFIDSTHVLATGSDVSFELFEVLPRLKAGVVVHFHDVFWPFEYPRLWAVDQNRAWNELQALRAFLMHNTVWEIVFFNDYFAAHARDLIAETYPPFAAKPGGALWLRKRG